MDFKSKVEEKVRALPEIYQTIYGHPEYNEETSRQCVDREPEILAVVRAYQNFTNKKELRVLDLGCAQGYYSFTLQNQGCLVDGIDFNEKNIDCCNALKEENNLNCNFKQAKIDHEFIDAIDDDAYDIVLILSVIHHVCHENGFEYARGIMEKLAKKGTLVVTELAIKEEPLYWNKNLPENYTEWFDNIVFFEEIAFEETHLSSVIRPLVLYGNRYAYYNETFYAITESKMASFDGKKEDKNRRYFLNDSILIKVYRGNDDVFKKELMTEYDFICRNCDKIESLPKPIYSKHNEYSNVVIYEIDKGINLWDMMKNPDDVSWEPIFESLLKNLIELETLGYYHGDLRVWNICVSSNKAFLIDFGNVQDSIEDLLAERYMVETTFTVYDAFMSLVYDCLNGEKSELIKEYEVYEVKSYYDLEKLNDCYQRFFKEYLLLKKDDITYEAIYALFDEYVIKQSKKDYTDREEVYILNKLLRRSINRNASLLDLVVQRIETNRLLDSRKLAVDNQVSNLQHNFSDLKFCEEQLQQRITEMQCCEEQLQQNILGLQHGEEEIGQRVAELQHKEEELQNRTEKLEQDTTEITTQMTEMLSKMDVFEQRICWLENTIEQRIKRKIKKILKRT